MKNIKGKRICQNCKEYCSIARKTCSSCNFEFISKKKPTQKEISRESIGEIRKVRIVPAAYSDYRVINLIAAPAGYSPIQLKKNPDQSDIAHWAHQLRLLYLKNNQWLLNEALRYYLRYDYDIFSETYAHLSLLINNLEDVKDIEIET